MILKVAKSNEEGLVIATGGEGEEEEKVNLPSRGIEPRERQEH